MLRRILQRIRAPFATPRSTTPPATRFPAVHEVLDQLDTYLWQQFTLEDFVTWLQEQYQRPLQVCSIPLEAGVFGAWCTFNGEKEMFFVDAGLQGLHRTQVVMHEVAHWLLHHPTSNITHEQLVRFLSGEPLIIEGGHLLRDPAAAATPSEQELEAEYLAVLLVERIHAHTTVTAVDSILKRYLA